MSRNKITDTMVSKSKKNKSPRWPKKRMPKMAEMGIDIDMSLQRMNHENTETVITPDQVKKQSLGAFPWVV